MVRFTRGLPVKPSENNFLTTMESKVSAVVIQTCIQGLPAKPSEGRLPTLVDSKVPATVVTTSEIIFCISCSFGSKLRAIANRPGVEGTAMRGAGRGDQPGVGKVLGRGALAWV